MALGLYAGSFDPFHLGHLAVVEQAGRDLDGVVVGVLTNPAKRAATFEDRLELAAMSTAHLPTVRCLAFEGLTVDLARREGVDVLVRAAHKEHAQERSMAAVNGLLDLPATFVTTEVSTRPISSTVVRGLIARGELEAATSLVPGPVARAVLSRERGPTDASGEGARRL